MISTSTPALLQDHGVVQQRQTDVGYRIQSLRLLPVARLSAAATGFCFTLFRVFFDEFNHQAGNVFLGGSLDAFQSRG